MQVMRLEKLVKLLEDQQDRAQAQRTRLEHRIAQLEVSLREKNKNSNRYVIMNKYNSRIPPLSTVDDRPSRAFSCESMLLEASTPTFHLVDPLHSEKRSGSWRHRYRHISSSKTPDLASRLFDVSQCNKLAKFYISDLYQTTSDKEETFVCEQCRREANVVFRDNMVRCVRERNHRRPIRQSLYGWLMGSSALEAFGEPTSNLNKCNNGLSSSEEDANCFFRIVKPYVVRNDEQNRSRRPRCRRGPQYYQHRCRFSKRSLYGTSPP